MKTDPHTVSSINECKVITLPRRIGDNGCLTEVENTSNSLFKIRRIYYIYDVPADGERGGHSHFAMESLVVAVCGSFDVVIDDGVHHKRITLNRPFQALHITRGIWRSLENFSSGSICLCIASEKYDEADYVRDYDKFLALTACKRNSIKIPFLNLRHTNAPYIEQLKQAACEVIESGHYIGGHAVESLERDLASICQTKFAIGTSNGLDALRLIFRAYITLGRLKPGDEVIVPADTFVATVLAITDNGLKPVMADVALSSYNLDIESISKAMTPRTRVIALVHLYGRVCWSEDIKDFARKHNLIIVEDNAQALGAKASQCGIYGTNATGGLGHAGAVSFYPTKNIGALGDAGAVTTHDAALAKAIIALRNYGSDRQYHNIYAGLNCRLDPIQAAMISVKLPYIDQENAHRREIAEIYHNFIANPSVHKPYGLSPMSLGNQCVWHQYVVLTPNRDHLRQYLLDLGIETGIHYPIPPHLQPCYEGLASGELLTAELIARNCLSLPINGSLSLDDARIVADAINQYKGF